MSTKESLIASVAERLGDDVRADHWSDRHESPSVEVLDEVVKLIAEVIFPEYLIECSEPMVQHHVVINLERIYTLLIDQISKAMDVEMAQVEAITASFIESIPSIKSLLTTDVEAIYKADPAATSYAEIVLCYPSVVAITHHRIAHSLHELGVAVIPRVIAEIAHSKCGIDIHPGATIAGHFAIDHGTGVVIGETTIIGENVVIYQGVTLGAKGFRFDEFGNAINIPRHPIIEDNVRIYSNSSILGRITIGHDSVIGGNMWIDKDIEPHSVMVKIR
ncbi:MAG: serine acetyltransferase [Rikenellaceae bacterium]